ncbi:MAG: DUF5652 family protein [Candidatus Peribacteraceae bacterium]|jgi:hypothetical protein|nr:DUF5652 family protein [Candidatus Peribacteraceae bacterium]
MMNDLSTLWQNRDFMMGAYNLNGALGLLFVLAMIDLVLKGWALWRAARMSKKWWFIALLLVNSMGIFPTIFLLMTNGEYRKNTGISTKRP